MVPRSSTSETGTESQDRGHGRGHSDSWGPGWDNSCCVSGQVLDRRVVHFAKIQGCALMIVSSFLGVYLIDSCEKVHIKKN